ncbi:HugZ family protein [Lacibacterium aquatile]|uniref:HugZ family protein n=1 Tax=Lacibacterium aquatile TaxID=1168082 RepID=A0ABW5DMR4_9PROT
MSNAQTIAELTTSNSIAVLGSLLPGEVPTPYASLMPYVLDESGAPLLLISGLAVHTQNIHAHKAVSLLVDGTGGYEDRLAGPRSTLVGQVEKVEKASFKDHYIARHPSAAMYYDFNDFELYRMTIERAHLVAGFGRVHWVEGDAVRAAIIDSLAA